jgi:pimeloyl-ACP methyl ester carboxylesterase
MDPSVGVGLMMRSCGPGGSQLLTRRELWARHTAAGNVATYRSCSSSSSGGRSSGHVLRPDGAKIFYEVRGVGPTPVLLLAPGGMTSQVGNWHAPVNPLDVLDLSKFRLIAMDQRGAGRSTGPLVPTGGWHTFTEDQLAVLDHLHIQRCLLIGSCIGPSYQLALMKTSPERFTAAVLMQPVGLAQHTTESEVWTGLNTAATQHWFGFEQDFPQAVCDELQQAMFGGMRGSPWRDFVFSVRREDVQTLRAPLLVLAGQDAYHPAAVRFPCPPPLPPPRPRPSAAI